MPDFVANCPISVPLRLQNVGADVDLGGVKFSYRHGMFYTPEAEVDYMTPPEVT